MAAAASSRIPAQVRRREAALRLARRDRRTLLAGFCPMFDFRDRDVQSCHRRKWLLRKSQCLSGRDCMASSTMPIPVSHDFLNLMDLRAKRRPAIPRYDCPELGGIRPARAPRPEPKLAVIGKDEMICARWQLASLEFYAEGRKRNAITAFRQTWHGRCGRCAYGSPRRSERDTTSLGYRTGSGWIDVVSRVRRAPILSKRPDGWPVCRWLRPRSG